MMKAVVEWLMVALAVGLAPLAWGADKPTGVFDNVGLYTDASAHPEILPFFKACGYNTYEVLDNAFGVLPKNHESFYAALATHITKVQQQGFKVYVIEMSNMEQKIGDGDPKYLYGYFPPRDEALMKERLDYIRTGIRHLKHADGFVFFAGDPGGYREAETSIGDCIAMARKVQGIVKEEAPRADFTFNIWAIAAWNHLPSPGTVEFWDTEVAATKEVLNTPNLIGPQMGIEFPLHNYYRSLALQCYAQANKEPELSPKADAIAELRKRKPPRMWGWPYFVIDECDDGYSGHTWGHAQGETRYLYQVVKAGRDIGLDGMIGNASINGMLSEVLNLYAFGRFCKDPKATPEGVIREFAGFLAEPASVDALVQVLLFLENNSSWQSGMPEKYRLPNFKDCRIDSPAKATETLASVKALDKSTFPMPEAPAAYLARLSARIKFLQDKANAPAK